MLLILRSLTLRIMPVSLPQGVPALPLQNRVEKNTFFRKEEHHRVVTDQVAVSGHIHAGPDGFAEGSPKLRESPR